MEAGPEDHESETTEAGADVPDGAPPERVGGGLTPLWGAQHEARYLRQALVRAYQDEHDCGLVVMIDQITDESVTYLAEVLHGHRTERDLHLMLCSPGGDGEVAIRLVRLAQTYCRRLVVVVPELAKSAATIMALGAHEIVMGPTSDLGPIDPQILVPGRGFVSAKDLIAAVDRALAAVSERPDTYPLHAAMLGGVDASVVEFARSAQARTGDIARAAIASNPERTREQIDSLCSSVQKPLIDEPKSHGAVIGADEATKAGLPVKELAPEDPQWLAIWALWTRYFSLGPIPRLAVYEGDRASQIRVDPT